MMRGTYQAIYNQQEREKEKESALEDNESLQQKITALKKRLEDAESVIDLYSKSDADLRAAWQATGAYKAKYKRGGV